MPEESISWLSNLSAVVRAMDAAASGGQADLSVGRLTQRLHISDDEAGKLLAALQKDRLIVPVGGEPGKPQGYAPDALGMMLFVESQERSLRSDNDVALGMLRRLREAARNLTAQTEWAIPDTILKIPSALASAYSRWAIHHAKQSVRISAYCFSWYHSVAQTIRERLSAGVEFVVMIADPEKDHFFQHSEKEMARRRLAELEQIGVRVTCLSERPLVRGTVVDSTLGLLALYDPDSETGQDGTTGIVAFTDRVLLNLVETWMKVFSSDCQAKACIPGMGAQGRETEKQEA